MCNSDNAGSRKILIWRVIINVKYTMRQTEEICVTETLLKKANADKLKTSVWQNLCWRTLLFSTTQRRIEIIGNSPYVNCQQEKSEAALRLVGLAASKNL